MDDLVLSPVAVIAISVVIGEEGTMAAVFGFEKGDIGIRADHASRFRENANERIIGGVQNERWDCDAIDHI